MTETAAPEQTSGFSWCYFVTEGEPAMISADSLLLSADAGGMLLIVVDQEAVRAPFGERQHLFIGTDGLHRPVSITPEGLAVELSALELTPDHSGQTVLLGLMDKYRPDMVYLSMPQPDTDSVNGILSFWSAFAPARDIRFIAYSPPSEFSRGWCVVSWRGLDTDYIPGLTFEGFMKTVAILAGLPCDLSVSTGVPAASILME